MIKPVPGYCLILPVEDEIKTTGGLYVPETEKDKPSRGRVVEISPPQGEEHRPWHNSVKKGDTIIFKRYVNQEIEYEGKKYLLINFNELLAVVE